MLGNLCCHLIGFKRCLKSSVYVVVQFYPSFQFYFPFFSMVMDESEFETKGNKSLN